MTQTKGRKYGSESATDDSVTWWFNHIRDAVEIVGAQLVTETDQFWMISGANVLSRKHQRYKKKNRLRGQFSKTKMGHMKVTNNRHMIN